MEAKYFILTFYRDGSTKKYPFEFVTLEAATAVAKQLRDRALDSKTVRAIVVDEIPSLKPLRNANV